MTANRRPKIMAGGPVRDRAWICYEWIAALLCQDYPPDRIVALVNDSNDETQEILEWYAQHFQQIEVYRMDFGCQVDNNIRGQTQRDYRQFAQVRNAWLNLRQDEDYLWMVDSDIICPPDTLWRLLSWRLPLVAALVHNDELFHTGWHTNGLKWLDPSIGPDEGYWWPETYMQSSKLEEVDVTGACLLIHRSVLDQGCHYREHLYGEDAPFCWMAQQKGFRLFLDCSTRVDHRLRPVQWSGQDHYGFARLMGEYWQWQANQLAKSGCD